MHAQAFSASRPQPGRPNEDAILVLRTAEPLFALFDGAGNAEGAAKKGARQLERLFHETAPAEIGSPTTWERWAHLLDSYMLGGSQSTFVGITVHGTSALGCAVGDSRAYLIRDGQARILTEGSAKQRLGSGRVKPFSFSLPLRPRDVLLLMSDGAWTRFALSQLAQEVMRSLARHPSELPLALLERAARGGITDDMTIIAVSVSA